MKKRGFTSQWAPVGQYRLSKGARTFLSAFPLVWCTIVLLLGAIVTPVRAIGQGMVHIVHIYNFDFSLNQQGEPIEEPVIQTGDTIRWVWDQGFHSTTAAEGQSEYWDSGAQSGGSFDHEFLIAGEYQYYSSTFGFDNGDGTSGGMSGTITVVPEPESVAMLVVGMAFGYLFTRSSRR